MTDTQVYIVDPNKTERDALLEKLSTINYKVQALGSGKDLLRKLKREGRPIVILDLDVEDMDAFDLIPKLRDKNKDVQLITITHNTSAKMRKKVARAGVMFHSTKPKHLLQLQNILNVTLEFENLKGQQAVM